MKPSAAPLTAGRSAGSRRSYGALGLSLLLTLAAGYLLRHAGRGYAMSFMLAGLPVNAAMWLLMRPPARDGAPGERPDAGAHDCPECGRAKEDSRQKELLVRHSQKMEAIGRLAGGVAHDFNNFLTAILGYTDFLLQDTDAADPRREDLAEIRKAASQAARLTGHLLAMSRRQKLRMQELRLNAVVEETRQTLQGLLGADFELISDLSPDLGYIQADPEQMRQVLLNLVVNAREAMPRGGRITVATRDVVLAETRVCRHGTLPAGAYVRLTVSDNGRGMAPEVLDHVFEPFFTTKPRGQGTGLGLADVYGIVTQCGGRIVIESAIDQGTTIQIYLRRIPPPLPTSRQPAAARC